MFKKDLIYICEWVDELPEGVTSVRLDGDGEICYSEGHRRLDFYPDLFLVERELHPCFIPDENCIHVGQDYTKEEFLACKEYLAKQEASVDDSTDPVVEQVKLRIQEITKRHEQALQEELKPLVEVLQRRGETL